jgi:hypothetical protein
MAAARVACKPLAITSIHANLELMHRVGGGLVYQTFAFSPHSVFAQVEMKYSAAIVE